MDNQTNTATPNGAQSVTQPVSTNQTPNTPPQRSSKSRLALFGLLVLFVVGIASAGAYMLGAKNNQPVQTQVVVSPTIFQPTQVSDPTEDWKIYTSEKANYSFKYPPEWPLVVVPRPPIVAACLEDIVFTPKYVPNSGDSTIGVILVCNAENVKSIDDYVNNFIKIDSTKIDLQHTTIDGERAISYKLSGGISPLPIIEYAVYKDGYYYILRLEDSAETNKNRVDNIKKFDQILSTFKFTQ